MTPRVSPGQCRADRDAEQQRHRADEEEEAAAEDDREDPVGRVEAWRVDGRAVEPDPAQLEGDCDDQRCQEHRPARAHDVAGSDAQREPADKRDQRLRRGHGTAWHQEDEAEGDRRAASDRKRQATAAIQRSIELPGAEERRNAGTARGIRDRRSILEGAHNASFHSCAASFSRARVGAFGANHVIHCGEVRVVRGAAAQPDFGGGSHALRRTRAGAVLWLPRRQLVGLPAHA